MKCWRGAWGRPAVPSRSQSPWSLGNVHLVSLISWRIFQGNSMGFRSSLLGCLFFEIQRTEEAGAIF